MSAVGRCDLGRHREHNEDSIYISEDSYTGLVYYIVADGMGGHNGGDVASYFAIKYFNEHVSKNVDKISGEEILDLFIEALNYCNTKVYEMSVNNSNLSGMGTTFTIVGLIENKAYCVHVGDSRFYIYNAKDGFKQITKDHSYVMEMVRMGRLTQEQAVSHPQRNVITKAIGIEDNVAADTYILDIESKSTMLLCTDGLSVMVEDKEIEKNDFSLFALTDETKVIVKKWAELR